MPKFDVTVIVTLERTYCGEIEAVNSDAAEAKVKRLCDKGELKFDVIEEDETTVRIEVDEV